ncbi:hypothetical protein A2856_03345 [Candidatus Uhrbacteria bacterium RIFCSPHIGHO2_01_FULL_63_20]|uniref:Glycosyltransferase 2-like domain-containing protein n=1 Tax=Candidatus Uhrbacteria bacterium RIFCSPHIGHO2_01_FULL_63_20 TaxID=1802385 RepID=A0A1F7TMJ4_9BACT|nr:MAG: hypothetical protein A2856_03345 [Candidatus Uhrbacteria bacterium RIFCSPHIGHO2_01_FULL_63_20]
MARAQVTIVAWNSLRYLPELLDSLSAQTFKDFQVLIVDNASTDGTNAYLRAHHPDATTILNARNLGFAAAHNQGIRYAMQRWSPDERAMRYVLVTNPDAILEPDYLERVVAEADAHPGLGSVGGKLLRAFGEPREEEGVRETMKSDLIDSTGLRATRGRSFADRGAGEVDRGQYDQARGVFGVSGALALYRASALEEAKTGEEYFDADFFAYKEDVDLAWRLRLLGWGSRFLPEAKAYHHRGVYGTEKAGFLSRLRERRARSVTRSSYSARNHWWLLMKNELALNALIALPWISARELSRVGYVALLETRTLGAFFASVFGIPRMWRKRREIMRRRKASASEMRSWFV